MLTALLVGIGGAVRPDLLGMFVVLAAVMNLGAYFFSDKLVLSMYRARPLPEEEAPGLHAMVRRLAQSAEIPMPRLYVVRKASCHCSMIASCAAWLARPRDGDQRTPLPPRRFSRHTAAPV